jgi:hypothetical protein
VKVKFCGEDVPAFAREINFNGNTATLWRNEMIMLDALIGYCHFAALLACGIASQCPRVGSIAAAHRAKDFPL